MSHRRTGTGRVANENEQVMTQVWHGFVDTVRRLPTFDTAASGKSTDEDRSRDLAAARSEKATIDDALEKIGVLIALRRGGSQAPSDVGTPTATGQIPGKRKGRRPSLSHISSGYPSPSPGPTSMALGSAASLESALSPGPAGGARDWARLRKEALLDQLPLAPGRKVAFKVPPAKASRGQEEESEEWIMAIIKRCLNQDKMRYEVQDIDSPESTWTSSLRSIIPLPDPTAPPSSSAHSSKLEDFPKDATVLALYPDTTTFYRATVISAPLPGTGMGLGVRGSNGRADPGAKRDKYRVKFEDDNDRVHEVDKFFVVLGPA